jgi:hypothetical protein
MEALRTGFILASNTRREPFAFDATSGSLLHEYAGPRWMTDWW